MAFSYVGNFPNQQFRNSGIYSLDDLNNLESVGELGGSLELIESQTITNSTGDFTNIHENEYKVHFATYHNMTMASPSGNQIPFYRLSNDGGSSYESSNYNSGGVFGTTDSNSGVITQRTTYGHLGLNQQGNHSWHGYVYFYMLGDSTKYSYSTFLYGGNYSVNSSHARVLGGSSYEVKETINAIRFGIDSGTTISGTISLYGVKHI